MCPIAARRHLAPAGAEMALNAFCVQVMAGTAIKRTCAVESGLVLVEPGLPQVVDVAVMAIFRIIAKGAVEIMAAAAGLVLRSQHRVIVGRVTVVPVNACRHLGSAGAEVALNAFGIEIMTGATIQSTGAVESGLIFIQPRPSGGVDVAVMTACRSIAE